MVTPLLTGVNVPQCTRGKDLQGIPGDGRCAGPIPYTCIFLTLIPFQICSVSFEPKEIIILLFYVSNVKSKYFYEILQMLSNGLCMKRSV